MQFENVFIAKIQNVKILEKIGGRDRDRTCDLMLAKHALSQLSYTPTTATKSILGYLASFAKLLIAGGAPFATHGQCIRFRMTIVEKTSTLCGSANNKF